MDHTDPPRPVDGRWRHILAVRDLASRMQLGWIPVASEDAAETCQALAALFRRHGPPLLLKSDNGSAFISDPTRRLLQSWQVFALLSPPRTPQYNGACEAAGGAMKTRSEHQAILHQRSGEWTAADLAAAQEIANHLHHPWGYRAPTPAQVWQCRQPITAADRTAFHGAVEQHRAQAADQLGFAKNHPLGRQAQARLDRLAIRRACVECGLLTFTQRSISPPITAHFDANIS